MKDSLILLFITMLRLILIQLALFALNGVTYANSAQEKSWMKKLIMMKKNKNTRHRRSTDDDNTYGPIEPDQICKLNYYETSKLTIKYGRQRYCKKCEEGFENPDPKNLSKCLKIKRPVTSTPKNKDSNESRTPTTVTTIDTSPTLQTSETIKTKEPTKTIKPTIMVTTTTSKPTTPALVTKNNNNMKKSHPRQSGFQLYQVIVPVVFFILAAILGIITCLIKGRRNRSYHDSSYRIKR